MKAYPKNSAKLIPLLATTAFLAGCGRAEFAFQDPGTFGQENPPTVCVPGGTTGTPGNGLTGSIKYLTPTEVAACRPTDVNEVLKRGHDAGVTVALNDLSVPTVQFTTGFYDPATG